ncbi:MAG: hypothetical protein QW568_01435 [Candidatus Anstonellaceae archaeon]
MEGMIGERMQRIKSERKIGGKEQMGTKRREKLQMKLKWRKKKLQSEKK